MSRKRDCCLPPESPAGLQFLDNGPEGGICSLTSCNPCLSRDVDWTLCQEAAMASRDPAATLGPPFHCPISGAEFELYTPSDPADALRRFSLTETSVHANEKPIKEGPLYQNTWKYPSVYWYKCCINPRINIGYVKVHLDYGGLESP